MLNPFALSSYQYALPEELIAQHPCDPRDSSRLMVIEKSSGNIFEIPFREIADYLSPGDSLVVNDTKVFPSRLIGRRKTGGAAEVFLTSPLGEKRWEALVRPGKKLPSGSIVYFSEDFACEIKEVLPDGRRIVEFYFEGCFDVLLHKFGQMPLPHYIKRESADKADETQYQTVYSQHSGSIAAPTAGLHFTEGLLERLKSKGIDRNAITLHVGMGTFKPVQTDDIREHQMHREHFWISPDTADILNARPRDKRQVCVGTTTCRALETIASLKGKIEPGQYSSNIFIHPGYQFRYVNHLLTNFHLPGSTLLMLVCTFAGYELTMEAYARAVKERYRFFSYGDAMLIIT